jgi:hypothetical protein
MNSLRFSLVLLVAFALGSPRPAEAAEVAMSYQGELIDGDSRPLSGVFPLRFGFFEGEAAETPLWSEVHYVSVADGVYDVRLGRLRPIPEDLDGRRLFVGVSVEGFGELTRVARTIELSPPPPTREEVIAALTLSFAELADRAVYCDEARVANDCGMLGGKRLEEIDRFDELLEQIITLRGEVDAATRVTTSSRTVTLERIGGAGGNPYARSCPPGHIVVGIRGGAGDLIDSIELVCAPLQ